LRNAEREKERVAFETKGTADVC